MPYVDVGDVSLCYETHGDPVDPPVLLIAGLGVQLIDWPSHILEPLVEAGHYAIVFDNRDSGLSTSFDGAPNDPMAVLEDLVNGREPAIGYTLADMAGDTIGLLDALGIADAHVLGVSMGAMIAQSMTIMYPERVRSLISIMGTTGAGDVGQAAPEAVEALMATAPEGDLETRLAHALSVSSVWASPGHYDHDWLRSMFERAWERLGGGAQPEHQRRQVCAIFGAPARDELLAMVDAPTLVIHGTADKLVDCSGGKRTAACISGSELLLIDGMGHDMPKAMAAEIVGAVSDHIKHADAAR